MTIEIETTGRRHYLKGDTYPIRAACKAAGCHWDRDAGAWWTGDKATAERLVGGVANGETRVECSWRKVGDDFVVAAPANKTGDTVTVRAASGSTKKVVLGTEVQPGLFAAVKTPRKARAPRQSLKLVGEETDLSSRFEGSKSFRAPGRKLGESCWLKTGSKRIAVVVVGYHPAQYISAEASEDMGHYEGSGYYGVLYYREGTLEQYDALQTRDPRADGVPPEDIVVA